MQIAWQELVPRLLGSDTGHKKREKNKRWCGRTGASVNKYDESKKRIYL